MTSRPKYKEMYLEQLRRCRELEKDSRDVKEAKAARSSTRQKHYNLHSTAAEFVKTISELILSDAKESNGWVQFPVISPENSVLLRQAFTDFEDSLAYNRPEPFAGLR